MEFYELAAYIFDKHFPVYITAAEKAIINEANKKEITVGINTPGRCGMDMFGTTYHFENRNAGYIAEMLSGTPATFNDEWGDNITANSRNLDSITINDMVELWAGTRRIEIANVRDIVTIHNQLANYLHRINEKLIWSPNYVQPPEEDMEKMRSFVDAISGKADGISFHERGDDAWSELQSFFTTTTYTGPSETQKVAAATLDIEDDDPFNFLKR